MKGSKDYICAKTMINAGAYGRFGLAPDGDDTVLVWDEDLDDWDFKSVYNGEAMLDSYIPFAVFVCAWARRHLLDNVYACMKAYGPDSVIHCDTDSVIHYGLPVETPKTPHGDHVGTWGIECTPPVIIEAGFKRYIELKRYPMTCMDDLIGMACAGVPQHWDYDHLYPIGCWVEILDDPEIILQDGAVLGHERYAIKSQWLRELYQRYGADPDNVDTLKLLPRKVKGGIILEGHTHTLNDNLIWRLRR